MSLPKLFCMLAIAVCCCLPGSGCTGRHRGTENRENRLANAGGPTMTAATHFNTTSFHTTDFINGNTTGLLDSHTTDLIPWRATGVMSPNTTDLINSNTTDLIDSNTTNLFNSNTTDIINSNTTGGR